ncbi:putative chromate ion transporter [Periconia macrospinosa]|uniref:Putative chromate ion transporter n=1 Tax=Periconia macrospinosa TaxID=97972 RepID=A0A2V1CY77_9PLEO|nr:putative chromate ion transporter [Periconia macrospinosa]
MHLPPPISRKLSSLRALARQARDPSTSFQGNHKSLPIRLADVFVRTWDLGFTAFGGPPVHFQILHQRFVEGRGGKQKWVDEQTYQELFAICQALPGPGSTKMIFCLALLHAGFVPALFVFLIWSLPGAIGMYALSLGVQRMNEVLPAPVYPLLSGLNASTVGIIALAAVQLGEKAIRDKLTRILVILGACAGLCYNALWYFPLLMLLGGLATVIWDGWLNRKIDLAKRKLKRRKQNPDRIAEETGATESVPLEEREDSQNGIQRRSITAAPPKSGQRKEAPPQTAMDGAHLQPGRIEDISNHTIRIRIGIAIVIFFFGSFIGILVARGVVNVPPLALDLFANMYLAGTIIFGGGPVVIPLLRSYVVDPGWVSSRDFLLGLAIIQAFPGPNFNFAVYLGALALQRSQFPTIFGAFLGFLGIFFSGITLAVAVQSFWRVLRRKKWVVDLLRGVNATAVGLVFTAVYRLWEIGYLTPEASRGQSLAMEPWWVVVAAVTYAESAWFNIPPALAIVFGAVLGLCWYGAVGR